MTGALIAAAYDFGVGLFHLMFWRLFGWPARLLQAGRVNTAVTQTLNIMLTYVLFTYAMALTYMVIEARPHAALLWAGAGFWGLRAVLQPILFQLRPGLNGGVSAVWLIGAGLHASAALAWF